MGLKDSLALAHDRIGSLHHHAAESRQLAAQAKSAAALAVERANEAENASAEQRERLEKAREEMRARFDAAERRQKLALLVGAGVAIVPVGVDAQRAVVLRLQGPRSVAFSLVLGGVDDVPLDQIIETLDKLNRESGRT